jgi:hypothetical protein
MFNIINHRVQYLLATLALGLLLPLFSVLAQEPAPTEDIPVPTSTPGVTLDRDNSVPTPSQKPLQNTPTITKEQEEILLYLKEKGFLKNTVVANLSIWNAQMEKVNKNTFKFNFDLASQDDKTQPNIRYAVKLEKVLDQQKKELVDEKINIPSSQKIWYNKNK